MTVRVVDVEVAFVPLGVAGRGEGAEVVFEGAVVGGIDVGDVEDDAAPPTPLRGEFRVPRSESRVGAYVGRYACGGADDIEVVVGADAVAGEAGGRAAVVYFEAEGGVEGDARGDVVGRDGDGVDGFEGRGPQVSALTPGPSPDVAVERSSLARPERVSGGRRASGHR